MINNLPFEKIIQIARRYGADFAEVFAEETHQTTIVSDDHKLMQSAVFLDTGVGIRVVVEGRTIYGSTSDLTKRNLLELARDTGRTAKTIRTRSQPVTLIANEAAPVTTVSQHPGGIPLTDKCSVVLRASETAWQAGKDIKQVRIQYRDVVRKICVASSDGSLSADEQVDTVLSVQVVAGKGDILQTGNEPVAGAAGFEIFDGTPPEELAEKAANRAILMLKARAAPAGTMPVVISSEAGGTLIHEAVGHGLEADLAGEGLSVYSGKIGQKVASDLVSVADDATLKARRGSFTFDDEGTGAKRTILIDHGVLLTYLTDRTSALRLGLKTTGNGRRQSYAHEPLVRMTNTLILPGKDDPEKILRDTKWGLFVKRMGGGQVNTINGDFVFDVQEGYLIENGRIGEAVRGALLIGNGPKVLNSIDAVGKDLGFSIGTCGKQGQEVPVSCGQPTIRVPELVVGGTEKR